MNYVLMCDGQEYEIGTSRVFGRADFPNVIKLSRSHFKISVSAGLVYAEDLGSANGTFLRGSSLTKNVSVQIHPGDQLIAGDLVFTCESREAVEPRSHWPIDLGIFWLLFACMLAPPTNAWGFALGVEGVTMILVTLAIPFAGCVYFFDRVCMRGENAWSLRAYGIGVTIGTALLTYSLSMLIQMSTDTERMLTEKRIRYFCLAKFNGPRCTQQIFECPTCLDRIGNLDRDKISQRLRADAAAREPAANSGRKVK